MKNDDAAWYEVRADSEILIFEHPLVWRLFFGMLGLVFAAIAFSSAYFLSGAPVQDEDGSRSALVCLIILFGLLAFPPLCLAVPYQVQLNFRRQAYETQHGLFGSRYGSFSEIKAVFIQQIVMGTGKWYRVRLSWKGRSVRWVPILAETPERSAAEALAHHLAERLEVPFRGIVER